MKRVRIMLIAIGVFAVAGGVLAFEAKPIGTTAYCITTDVTAATCSFAVSAATFLPTGPGCQMKYVARNPASPCSPAPLCSQVGFLGH